MSFVLDAIYKIAVFSGPQTVNTDWTSNSVDMTKVEAESAFTLVYSGGAANNVDFYLQSSSDNVTFANIGDSLTNIADASGTIIFDLSGTGVNFIRVFADVAAGSLDIDSIGFSGKRRH